MRIKKMKKMLFLLCCSFVMMATVEAGSRRKKSQGKSTYVPGNYDDCEKLPNRRKKLFDKRNKPKKPRDIYGEQRSQNK